MKPVRWGIVGAGRIAHQFASDLGATPGSQLVAVASRNAGRGADFASRHAIPRCHTDYQALYDDPGVDVVYVATPHALHHANAAGAMRSGKAVLCEKPITTSPEELLLLQAIAAECRTYLAEGMWTWFLPAIREAHRWVVEGRIGAIRHVRADFGYPMLPFDAQGREYNPALGGGVMLDMGIYPVALAWRFLGRQPDHMEVVGRRAPNGVEDDVAILADYGECSATLTTSFRCKLHNWAYVIGTEGYVAIPDFWRARECQLYRGEDCIDRFSDGRQTFGFDSEAAAVAEDLRAGRKESAVVALADSLAWQRQMQQVRERILRQQEP